jgi:hypothetical protein
MHYEKPVIGIVILLGIVCWLELMIPACSQKSGEEFAIYLVENGEIAPEASATDLAALTLGKEPMLTMQDIEYYDYSTHYIFLKEECDLTRADLEEMKYFADRPFVVVAGGERIYLGYFHSMFSSAFPPLTPLINVPVLSSKDIIHIEKPWLMAGQEWQDVRFDDRIKSSLDTAGKLELGIKAELLDVEYPAGDETTISYTIKITSQSERTWYIPDTDKMGAETFVYYTNGIILSDGEKSYSYQIKDVPLEFIEWQKSWYTALSPGESLTRTVTQTDFNRVPSGQYSCGLIFGGENNIEKADRDRGDGLIWMGEVAVEPLKITVQLETDPVVLK